MQPTGSLNNLAERLKEKTEQDRQQMENIVNKELANLRQNLSAVTQNALSTIKSDMEREIRKSRETLKEQIKVLSLSFAQRWLTASLIALAILLGLAMGGLGLVKLAERKAMNLHQEISRLQKQQTQLEITVQQLQTQTWGLDLLETPDGRFIVLPPKTIPKTGWTKDGRQVVKVE